MAIRQISWTNLLRMAELDILPSPPDTLMLEDEVRQVISWLTGCTRDDRRLIRCDNNGALLTNDAWSLLNQAEIDELYPDDGVPDSFTATKGNKGVLIATSTKIIKITFIRVSGGATENIYLPPNWLYYFPYSVYSVTATVVPAVGGTASYIGITTFN